VSGNGSVFEKTLVGSESFGVNGMKFENCNCLSGNGGAVWVKVPSTGTLRIGNESSVEFKTCTASGYGGGLFVHFDGTSPNSDITSVSFPGCTAQKGTNMVIDAVNLSTLGVGARVKFNMADAEYAQWSGFEGRNYSFAIPLVLHRRSWPSPAYVGGDNMHDHSFCGNEDYPCATIEWGGKQRFGTSKATIRLNAGFIFNQKLC